MNVFVDFHHASLLNSFILLFEKRLGGNVYRPIGMDWATQGYWRVYDHPATQEQYLGIGGATPDGTPPLNDVDAYDSLGQVTRGIFNCQDIDSGLTNKAITFNAFMSMPFDIVIDSLPQHLESFKKLCELHPSKPKLIYQIGNQWDVMDTTITKNVMCSALIQPGYVPQKVNFISYHQEFDTSLFHPDEALTGIDLSGNNILVSPAKNIYSFVNVFYNFPDWSLFEEVERLLSDFTFRSYGGQCRDGAAHGSKELADKMREARFIWHTKAGGDGYGHVLFNTAAVGRPLITKKSYYSGKLGEKLMIDGETCINIDNLTVNEIVDKIKYYSQPELYKKMSERVYQNFTEQVNFDKEEQEIRKFLDRLV